MSPQFTSKTKIIKKSDPYGIPPVVVRPSLNIKLKHMLKQIFLEIHNDTTGKMILDKMKIDKFVEIDDSAYDSIRKMKNWTQKKP